MRSLRAYRHSATEGANHIDILLACYDALAEDMRLAGQSALRGDIPARCRHSEHALLLIGHLESWVSFLDDVNLAASLTNFYEHLRAEVLRLQVSLDFNDYMNLALVVCEVRATWQKKLSTELSQRGTAAATQHPLAECDGAIAHFIVSA